MSKIGPQSTVELRYRIYDTDGELVESNDDEELAEVPLGRGFLPDQVESALIGRARGDSFRIDADLAFGPHDPEQLVSIPFDALDGSFDRKDVKAGDLVPMLVEPDEGEEGEPEEVEVEVVEVNDDGIVVDLNHPLAGLDLVFEIEIVSVS